MANLRSKQPRELQNPQPISPSARSQSAIDEQRRQMTETGSTIRPQRQNQQDASLFVHRPKITPVEHPSRFIQPPRGDMPTDLHPGIGAGGIPVSIDNWRQRPPRADETARPGASSRQSPNDHGRTSRVPG